MKLVQILPEQIMQHWDRVKGAILEALPPYVALNDASVLEIQSQLLTGTLQCWVATANDLSNVIYGLMTTKIVHDPVSSTKNLLIYTVTVTNAHPKEMWQLAAAKMRQYAQGLGCNQIIAYSSNEAMLEIAEKLGADTSYRLVMFFL